MQEGSSVKAPQNGLRAILIAFAGTLTGGLLATLVILSLR